MIEHNTESADQELVAKLPELPDGFGFGGGYDWMDELADTGWHAVSLWGRDGWNLGDWPYVIVAHYDGADVFGLATYCEGDLNATAYATREARDAATDAVAAWYWRNQNSGPADLPALDCDMQPHHRGPFSWSRAGW